ncbi:pilus assembly protein N-terminal domain-containing protein [Neomegalonema sp.]|uniref:pilus assembly protein N-terminal domain-containing protein n=1 Tax=Neomegalonema sp. TaxID=2039713 RepID=UPI002638170F|nr:pilus assembly protein N-terminal domain-containing protein [Neomegalonema sp.]MDD2869393.1 pilus assembly protein N-terminal domain-containing protein [Neomegalonema sp.]
MDGEKRAGRRTAAIVGLLAICAAGAAQADSPGAAKYRAQNALTGAPVYDAGRASAPVYSPGDRPPTALYGQPSAPLTTGPIYNPSPMITGGLPTGPIYDPYGASAAPVYAPTYQAAPLAPQPPAYARQNDVFGYAPSAACGGLLEGERCLVILGDHTRRVRLDREATTILVGNPAVADVTVLSKRTMFVSARSVGSTNIVALDENEEEIASWEVFVREPEAKRVTLRQGPTRENYQCAPYCERSLSQNDSPSAHSSHLGVINAEMGLDRTAVGAQTGGMPPDAFEGPGGMGGAPAPAPKAETPAAPAGPLMDPGMAAMLQSMLLSGAMSSQPAGANERALSPGGSSSPTLPPPDYLMN